MGGVEHRHPPATARQAGSNCGARQTSAHHDALACRSVLRCSADGLGLPGGVVFALQVVALGRYARNFVDNKAALRQSITHAARNRPGRHTGAAPAAARHGFEGMHIPNIGIFLGAEPIEKDGVGFECRLAQHRLGIPDAKRQQHLTAFKLQPLKTW